MGLADYGFPVLFLLMGWRAICKYDKVQVYLHSLGSFVAPFLQWHFWFFVSLLVVLIWTLADMIIIYNRMTDQNIENNANDLFKVTNITNGNPWQSIINAAELASELKISPWLLRLNLASQLAGVPVFILAAYHCWKIVRAGETVARLRLDSKATPWMPSQKTNTTLFALAMPAVFSTWAMRSTLRVWALAVGDVGVDKGFLTGDASWDDWRRIQLGRYRADMELASAFQFFAVFSFGRLCSTYLMESDVLRAWNYSAMARRLPDQEREEKITEHKRALEIPAFLGVHAFVVVGVLRCLVNVLTFNAKTGGEHKVLAYQVNQKILGTFDSIFTFCTVLCVINMIIICKMKLVTEHLGNATVKFLGTRLLLIFAQIQMQVIFAFKPGSEMFEAVRDYKKMLDSKLDNVFDVDASIAQITINEYQAHLLHTSLLVLECLAVVILNRIVWPTELEEADLVVRSDRDFESENSFAVEEPELTSWQRMWSCCRSQPLARAPYSRIGQGMYPGQLLATRAVAMPYMPYAG